MKRLNESEKFENALIQIIKVKHSEIKEKLDTEKAAKKGKKFRKSSASGRAANDRA